MARGNELQGRKGRWGPQLWVGRRPKQDIPVMNSTVCDGGVLQWYGGFLALASTGEDGSCFERLCIQGAGERK